MKALPYGGFLGDVLGLSAPRSLPVSVRSVRCYSVSSLSSPLFFHNVSAKCVLLLQTGLTNGNQAWTGHFQTARGALIPEQFWGDRRKMR